MVLVLSVTTVVLLLIVICLSVKIYYLKHSANEIAEAFLEHLNTDTNTLIDISSRDRHMCALAENINVQLRELRRQRLKYLKGDSELKEAVTNISHDLRTPLTAIYGYLELMEDEDKSENVARYLECIKNRAEHMKQLTEELFKYSIIMSASENIELEEITINGVLEECIAGFYGALTEKKIVPVIDICDETVVRRLNKTGLVRVFNNVLNNALKYSDGDLDISMSPDGEIVFANTASGLSEVQVGKMFDRFFTVESARHSTGLGLAIAKNMVEQMNGTIIAKYENDKLSICIKF